MFIQACWDLAHCGSMALLLTYPLGYDPQISKRRTCAHEDARVELLPAIVTLFPEFLKNVTREACTLDADWILTKFGVFAMLMYLPAVQHLVERNPLSLCSLPRLPSLFQIFQPSWVSCSADCLLLSVRWSTFRRSLLVICNLGAREDAKNHPMDVCNSLRGKPYTAFGSFFRRN